MAGFPVNRVICAVMVTMTWRDALVRQHRLFCPRDVISGLSADSHASEQHVRRRVGSVEGFQFARQGVFADQSADAELEMAVGEKVVDVAQAELAGPERFVRQRRTLREQFILVSAFESSENGMGLGERNG